MRPRQFLAALALGTAAALPAWALDIAPYSAAAFSRLQQSGQAVALHFHADWCPTCRAQEKVFAGLKGDAGVPGTLLVVNYDRERELKRQLGVRMQSTLILYRDGKESGRLAGETDAARLRSALTSGR